LDGIDADHVAISIPISAYRPYRAVRAHLLQQLGRTIEALDAFDRAIGLPEEPAVRQFLLRGRANSSYFPSSAFSFVRFLTPISRDWRVHFRDH
jgi:hypothetical protein